MLARNGVCSITAAISPYSAVRDECRAQCDATFVEVYVEAPLAVVEERDTKGLYAKAAAGGVKHFTGKDSLFEEPDPSTGGLVVIDTEDASLEDSTDALYRIVRPLIAPQDARGT